MDKREIADALKGVIGDYLKNQGFDLVEILLRYEGRDLFLRILADRPAGGITMDECAFLNSGMDRILEEKDVLKERYILEVSSPGLDRPLKEKNDFRRCINKKVRIFLKEPVNEKLEWEGEILKTEDEAVCIEVLGEGLKIPFDKIQKGKEIISNS